MASNSSLCAHNVSANSLKVKSGLGFKTPVVALADKAASGAIRSGLTAAESGTIFTVPVLTSGTQTIALPPPSAETVGVTYTFVAIGNSSDATALGQVFNVLTDATATKILASTQKGDGDLDADYAQKNSYGFTATAIPGASFTIVGVSSAAATAWVLHHLQDSLAGQTDSHVMA